MGIYGIAVYGVDKYGEAPRLAFSVSPFTATAVDYDTIQLNWAAPEGSITKIRLVRSQDGFPETEEDGIILWEWSSDSNQPRINNFEDSPSNSSVALTSGRFSYYRVWLLQGTTNKWLIAGEAYTIVPRAHDTVSNDGTVLVSTHQKFLDLIPRVFTSASQSPLDAVDENSDLSRFLRGFSFTLDEIMTLADNILPEESGRFINPELIGLRAQNFGLEPEAYIATQNQKRLIREAMYLYANKGTKNAIETYAESLTGFAPIVTSSPNLLLSVQDSSFYKGLGNWKVAGDATLALEQTIVPVTDTTEPDAVDYGYTAKFTCTGAASIVNGLISPKLYGAPINAGSTYSLSTYVKRESGTSLTVTPVIYWYDYAGALISTSTGSAASVSGTNWTKVSSTATAPGAPATVTSYAVSGTTATLTVASTAGFAVGDTIIVFGVDEDVDGEFEITALTSTTLSYTLTAPLTVPSTPADGIVRSEANPATYAVIEFKVSGTAVLYFDMVQLALSSVTTYHEARAIELFLNPKKTNELKNPSFNSAGSAEWTITAASSTYNGELTVDSTANGLTSIKTTTDVVQSGRYYTFSIYAKMAAGSTSAETVKLKINSYDQAAASGDEIADVHEVEVTLTNEWARYHVTGFISSNPNPIYLEATIYGTTTGEVMVFDSAQVESSYRPTDYFDGAAPASYGAVWEDGAHVSRSHIYPNKVVKTTRLAETLRDWIPINRPYIIKSYAGTEAKVI